MVLGFQSTATTVLLNSPLWSLKCFICLSSLGVSLYWILYRLVRRKPSIYHRFQISLQRKYMELGIWPMQIRKNPICIWKFQFNFAKLSATNSKVIFPFKNVDKEKTKSLFSKLFFVRYITHSYTYIYIRRIYVNNDAYKRWVTLKSIT